MRAHRRVSAFLLFAGLLIAAPACASGPYYGGQRTYPHNYERQAYQNGFDRGARNGERDARDRRPFQYTRDSDYRDADWGYRRGEMDREDYRRSFRRGYEAGYSEAFNRLTRAYGPGSQSGGAAYVTPAAQNGYRDGFEAGRNDARDRARYDPILPRRYRDGDHDYDRRYGSREEYKREYRAAFQQGYERGYREYRR